MPRGKKTDPETVYKVLVSYAITKSYSKTARELDIPITTVKKLVKDNNDKPEFVKLCNEKKESFAEKADEIIDLLLDAFKKKALSYQDDEVLTGVKITEISTSLGTLYDKRALANGESTDNTKIVIKLGDADEYGG